MKLSNTDSFVLLNLKFITTISNYIQTDEIIEIEPPILVTKFTNNNLLFDNFSHLFKDNDNNFKTDDIIGSPETHLWYDFCKLLSQTIKNNHKFETIFGNNKKEFYQLYLKHHKQLYTKVFNDTKDNSNKLYNDLKTTYYNITIKGYNLGY